MTSSDDDRSSLFLAPPVAPEDADQEATLDAGAEAMRRLRDPFAVQPAGPAKRPAAAESDGADRQS